MRALNENQTDAIERLGRLKVGALFMACGTGKTQTAVTLVNSVDDVDYLLWITPCRVKENLAEELEKCGLRYKADIVGIESIGQSERIYSEALKKAESAKRAFIVCDESIKIKNIWAKRTRRAMTLARNAEYKLILNGTPLTKGLIDIYPQMEFLSPQILDMKYYEFLDTFCCYTAIKRCGRVIKRVITDYTNIEYLRSLINPYVYECDLSLRIQKSYDVYAYELGRNERKAYDRLKDMMCELEEFRDNGFLGMIQKMQHSYCVTPEKFEILEELVDDRTIVYCKFIKSAEAVKEKFPEALVLTYGKGSFGLNLQQYNRVIYFDKTFDYAFREQSEARIYRTGQQDNCHYYDLTGDVGLESLIDKCISRKENLIDYFKRHGISVTSQL